MRSSKKSLIIAVSEGVRWYNDETGKVEKVYASSEVDEYGHPRFGGISGIISSDITKKLGIEARSQITGYYARSGECRYFDRRLTAALADKVADLLIREDYGRMPVLNKIVKIGELEEFNTSSIDMGQIGNRQLQNDYYNINEFNFTPAYMDFLSYIMEPLHTIDFNYDFPVVIP